MIFTYSYHRVELKIKGYQEQHLCYTCVRNSSTQKQQSDVPVKPEAAKQSDGPKNAQGSNTGRQALLISGGLTAAGFGFLCLNEDARVFVCKKIPVFEPVFKSLGLCITAPDPRCDEELIKKELQRMRQKREQNKPSSMATIAEKSVAHIDMRKAAEADLDKRIEKTEKAVMEYCKAPPCCGPKDPVTKPLGALCSASEHNALFERKVGGHDGASVYQSAEDAAKLIFPPKRPRTPEEIEARNKKEEELHKQKKLEQERKDAEFLNKQKEKAEQKAAIELEKQKLYEREQKCLAESLLTRAKKNQEFELKASKDISEAMALADKAINNNVQAIKVSKEHGAKLKEAMDAELEEVAMKIWPVVNELNDMRLQRLAEAKATQQEVEDAIVAYITMIDTAKKDADTRENENLQTFKRQIEQLAFEVKSTGDSLRSTETVSDIMKHYYYLYQKDKDDFRRELEAIVPEVKLGEKGLKMTEEELNALLAHSHRRIFQLKKQLHEQQLLEHQRLEDAICDQKKNDSAEATQKINQELENQYTDLQLQKEAELMALASKHESEIAQHLSKLASEHQDHLQDMLAVQEKRLAEQFDLALRERLVHERHIFIDQIQKHMAKVTGLEAALEERADLEKIVVEVQDLMSSAMTLMHAIASDDGKVDRRIELAEPLERCARAGEENTFVQAIIHGVPPRAAHRGILNMTTLEKRFDKVFKETYKALGMASYYLGVLPPAKYQRECDFEHADGMSSKELLVQAKHFVDRQCISGAVRCLVQLEGLPRTLAQDWIEEARLVLECRQAAEALYSYANSKGMGTIF